jgi:galactokinase
MVGGGFGGSAIALVEAGALDRVRTGVAAAYRALGRPEPRTFVAVPSAGARRVR